MQIDESPRHPNRQPDSQRGAALIEWALLVILVAIIAMIGVMLSGQEVSSQYSEIASAVGGA